MDLGGRQPLRAGLANMEESMNNLISRRMIFACWAAALLHRSSSYASAVGYR